MKLTTQAVLRQFESEKTKVHDQFSDGYFLYRTVESEFFALIRISYKRLITGIN